VRSYFGEPGNTPATAGIAELPYPMKMGWERNQIIHWFRCHAKAAEPVECIFQKTLAP
jgi:hypothetical protein